MEDYDELYEEHVKLQNKNMELMDTNTMLMSKIAQLSQSLKYGATFHFFNSEPKLQPIFSTVRGITSNGERPHKYELNFDDDTLADWLEECEHTLIQETKNE